MSKKIATIQTDGQAVMHVAVSATPDGKPQLELYISGVVPDRTFVDTRLVLSSDRARVLATAIEEGLYHAESRSRRGSE